LIAAAFVISGAATAVALLPFAGTGSRTTVVAPIPLPAPVPTNRPPPTPPPTLALSRGPTTAPRSDPVERFDAIIQAGLNSGQIRPEVATDLRNLLGGLGQSVANIEQTDVVTRATGLRRTIDERARQGGISQSVALALQQALDAFVPPRKPTVPPLTGPPTPTATPTPTPTPTRG
jgi:hypothetical protein